MNQFSIITLEESLSKDTTYKAISKQYGKDLYYDKCNWLITRIIRTQLKSEKGLNELVNIHTDTLKLFLGNRYYQKVIKTLTELEIIYVNKIYSAGNFSYSYALKKKLGNKELVEVGTRNKSFREKLKKQGVKEYQQVVQDKVLYKVLVNTTRLLLTNKRFGYIEEFSPLLTSNLKGNSDRGEYDDNEYVIIWYDDNVQLRVSKYEAYFKSFRLLNETTNPKDLMNLTVYFSPTINKLGRVYHIGASIPRLVRECFVTKNKEPIWEIDMASAQPTILILEWLNTLKEKQRLTSEEKEEYQKYYDLIIRGELYAYVKEYSRNLKNLEYGKMKKAILTTLNSEHNKTPLYFDLKHLFPLFMSWIDQMKNDKGYKAVSHLGHRTEANIFVEVYKQLPDELFALIIHDCILTTEPQTLKIKELLMKRLKSLYPNVFSEKADLNKMFKIDRVTHQIIGTEKKSLRHN